MAKPIRPRVSLGKHPDPPQTLSIADIEIVTSKGPWFRLNPVPYSSALYFDRSGEGRFDGPDQGYGILYLGEDLETCFIECFGRTHTKAVEEQLLRQRNLFSISSSRSLTFARLSGSGLVKLAADSRLTTGDYKQARKWVRSLWGLNAKLDGILYRSRLDNDRLCYGLFDQCISDLVEENLGNLIDVHPQQLAKILGAYDYHLL